MGSLELHLVYFLICLLWFLIAICGWLYYCQDSINEGNADICKGLLWFTPAAPFLLGFLGIIGLFYLVINFFCIYLPRKIEDYKRRKKIGNIMEEAWKETLQEETKKQENKNEMTQKRLPLPGSTYADEYEDWYGGVGYHKEYVPASKKEKLKPGEKKSFRDTFESKKDSIDDKSIDDPIQ